MVGWLQTKRLELKSSMQESSGHVEWCHHREGAVLVGSAAIWKRSVHCNYHLASDSLLHPEPKPCSDVIFIVKVICQITFLKKDIFIQKSE